MIKQLPNYDPTYIAVPTEPIEIRPSQLNQWDIIRIKGTQHLQKVRSIVRNGNTYVISTFEISRNTIPTSNEFTLSESDTLLKFDTKELQRFGHFY